MSNDGGKDWDKANLQLMFNSLTKIDNHLNGHLRSMVVGSTFWLSKHPDSGGEYNGSTNTIPPSGITFFTKSTQALRQQNIFHEVGHLLDNVRGIWDVFTNAVANEVNPCWVASDDKINPDALLGLYLQNDPNYASVEARQTYSHFGSSEQWADAFANYVAGNINLGSTAGTDMYNFVTGALAPYIGNP